MTSEGTQMYMPVAPAYNGGMGGDGLFGGNSGWWLILLLIVLGGWNGGFGGFGGGNGMFPYMMSNNTTSDVQRGFDQSAIITGITGVQNAVTSGFGDVQTALCGGFAGVNAGIANGFAQAEIAANARQMADMQQGFALQSAMQNCCCTQTANTADLKYTIATEASNTRSANTANTQAILDKLCQLELDTVKNQLADANNTIGQLRTQLLVSQNEASQTAQTAQILAGQAAEIDGIYNRLNNCPVPSVPVYGRTPVYSCGGTSCGCGMAA